MYSQSSSLSPTMFPVLDQGLLQNNDMESSKHCHAQRSTPAMEKEDTSLIEMISYLIQTSEMGK